jgi:predicted RNA binding protein YcfA (HicA-like mRNA interferase family)
MKPYPARAKQVEKILFKIGFLLDRQSGSHRIYYHADGRRVVVPFHPGDIPTGTLRNIIKTAGISIESFNTML